MRNQRPKAPQDNQRLEIWRIGAAQQRTPLHQLLCAVTLWSVEVADREATVNACGVAVAMLGGHSWTPTLSNGWKVNVGTILPVP